MIKSDDQIGCRHCHTAFSLVLKVHLHYKSYVAFGSSHDAARINARDVHLVAHPRCLPILSRPHAVPLSGSQNLCPKQLDRPPGATPPFRDPSFTELCLFRDHHTPHHQPVNPRSLQALPQASRPKPGLSTMAFASPFRLFVTLICRADSLSGPASQPQSPIAARKYKLH